MTDLTGVTQVIDAQAAAFFPVTSWRATTGIPFVGQYRLISGSAQFCQKALQRQPPQRHHALSRAFRMPYAPDSAIDTLPVRPTRLN
jgi:hypothetical protein